MDDKISPGNRVFRRKKRFQGAAWTPSTISASPEDGLWCPRCHLRHGYKSSTRLGISYEKSEKTGRWKVLWYCKLTGNVLREQLIGGTE